MKTLVELFNEGKTDKYPTDKNTSHSYLEIYDKLFAPYQDKPINFLEVGFHKGGSLKLFEDYFTQANIIGYDIENYMPIELDRAVRVIKNINDVTDDEFSETPLTIAIDDGSHRIEDQLVFLQKIYPQVVEGGLLIIEDVQSFGDIKRFHTLNIPYHVIDRRHEKNRYDDVLLVFKK